MPSLAFSLFYAGVVGRFSPGSKVINEGRQHYLLEQARPSEGIILHVTKTRHCATKFGVTVITAAQLEHGSVW